MANELGIGSLAPEGAQRDAIHVAVVPLVAQDDLYRGERVRLDDDVTDGARQVRFERDGEAIGIVDPFLSHGGVEIGERFWCFLLPGTVDGMRHHWHHPLIDRQGPGEAEKWLRNFADAWSMDFEDMVRTAREGDGYIVAGTDLHGSGELGEDYYRFWEELERYLGREFTWEHRESVGWSCSC